MSKKKADSQLAANEKMTDSHLIANEKMAHKPQRQNDKMADSPQIWIITPFERPDAGLAVAAAKAGAFSALHLGRDRAAAEEALSVLAGRDFAFGVCFADGSPDWIPLPANIKTAILPWGMSAETGAAEAARPLTGAGVDIIWQVTSAREADEALAQNIKTLIIKGAEGAGRCGEESSFILFQQLAARCRDAGASVLIQGGVGVHSAAAYMALGAAGVVLDSQVALFPECGFPQELKTKLSKLSGNEIKNDGGYNYYAFPGAPGGNNGGAASGDGGVGGVSAGASGGNGGGNAAPAGGGSRASESPASGGSGADDGADEKNPGLADNEIALGQDIILSADLAGEYKKLGSLVRALLRAPRAHINQALIADAFMRGGETAAELGTEYPVAQGPMARISDTPEFLRRVAEGGALPFLAMGLSTGKEASGALAGAAEVMAGRPWGVGILGFAFPQVLEEQMKMIVGAAPPFVLIAGGRTAQAKAYEKAGIKALLHAPTPGTLDMFLKDGARRFIFEGRESGGHVGPLYSAVLWDKQVGRLINIANPSDILAFFAGGIHDALSAAFVRVMTGSLAARGVKTGLQCGTAYLYTAEAVASGAITPVYQRQLIEKDRTLLLKSGAGQETRCVSTPFTDYFLGEKAKMEKEGRKSVEILLRLEELNLGRLRVAAKGVERSAGALAELDEADQLKKGLYMTGAVTAIKTETSTIAELHRALAPDSYALLTGIDESKARRTQARRHRQLPSQLPLQSPPQSPQSPQSQPPARIEEQFSQLYTQPRSQSIRQPLQPPGRLAERVDIAVIGMAGIFPGAADADEFWRNIVYARDCITEIPKERWPAELFYDPDSADTDHVVSKWGGFLGATDFDALEFGITPQSLASIEPAQLLSLLVAKRALEDAGFKDLPREDLENTAVIFGTQSLGELANAYGSRAGLIQLFGRLPDEADKILPRLTEDSFPGILSNVTAGRISNRLDTGGRNFTVDAACASSLAALDIAISELLTHRSDMVILGGADTHNGIFDYLMFSSTHALSKKGRCATFDADADGITIGEGVGVVVLKRLADAERDHNKIYAVIKGAGASSDGKNLGLTAPSRRGQVRALENAYENAGVSPSEVGYIEPHGTGTAIGDRIELRALTEVFLDAGAKPGQASLSSLKSLIGHTKCAAGVAGLIKAVNCVRHGVLPPTLHLKKPNEYYTKNSPFVFRTEKAGYWRGDRRVAGVSGFGFGGTNYHAVICNYCAGTPKTILKAWPSELFVFGGETDADAPELMNRVKELYAANDKLRIRDVAYSLAAESRGKPVRYAIVAGSREELLARIDQALGGAENENVRHLKPISGKVAFLFPGQGSQRVNMAADLFLLFPRMRRLLNGLPDLERILYPDAVFSDDEKKRQNGEITDTRNAQPLLGIVDFAMAELLREFGVAADMAAGHSYGELPALCFAGAFAPEDLAGVSRARAEAILASVGDDRGRMAAVAADAKTVAELAQGLDGVWPVNYNSPKQTVVAASKSGMDAFIKKARSAGVSANELNVACAFHSPLLKGADEKFAAALKDVRFYALEMPVWSNTTAGRYPDAPDGIRERLCAHLVNPVLFSDEIGAMAGDGAAVFVEAGPGGVLTKLVSEITAGKGTAAIQTERGGADGLTFLLQALAKYTATGRQINMDKLFEGRDAAMLNVNDPAAYMKGGTVWSVDGRAASPAGGGASARAGRPMINAAEIFNQYGAGGAAFANGANAAAASPVGAAAAITAGTAAANPVGVAAVNPAGTAAVNPAGTDVFNPAGAASLGFAGVAAGSPAGAAAVEPQADAGAVVPGQMSFIEAEAPAYPQSEYAYQNNYADYPANAGNAFNGGNINGHYNGGNIYNNGGAGDGYGACDNGVYGGNVSGYYNNGYNGGQRGLAAAYNPARYAGVYPGGAYGNAQASAERVMMSYLANMNAAIRDQRDVLLGYLGAANGAGRRHAEPLIPAAQPDGNIYGAAWNGAQPIANANGAAWGGPAPNPYVIPGGGAAYDPMYAGSQNGAAYDPMYAGAQNGAAYGPMYAGSQNGVAYAPAYAGSQNGAAYDPMYAGSQNDAAYIPAADAVAVPETPATEAPVTEAPPDDIFANYAPIEDAPEAAGGEPQTASGLPHIGSLTNDQIMGIVFEITSDKTGYPVSMLEPDMDLEADLSIDSIKKMEIIDSLQSKIVFPDMSQSGDALFEKMISIRKFRDLSAWLEELGQTHADGSRADEAAAGGEGAAFGGAQLAVDLGDASLYEGETYEDEPENDITPVALTPANDIFAGAADATGATSTADATGTADATDTADVTGATGTADVTGATGTADATGATRTADATDTTGTTDAPGATDAHAAPDVKPAAVVRPPNYVQSLTNAKSVVGALLAADANFSFNAGADAADEAGADNRLIRMVYDYMPNPIDKKDVTPLAGKTFLLTDDGGGLASGAAESLCALGVNARVIDGKTAPEACASEMAACDGLLLINSASGAIKYTLIDFFRMLKIVNMDRLNWLYVFDDTPFAAEPPARENAPPGGAPELPEGFSGFLKSLFLEYPGKYLRSVISDTRFEAETFTGLVLDELNAALQINEIIYRGGERYFMFPKVSPIDAHGRKSRLDILDGESVIVVLGGAQGIVPYAVERLAAEAPCRYILMGRTFAEPVGAEYERLETIAEIRSRLISHEGMKLPREIEARAWKILKSKRIASSVAHLNALGAKAEYVRVDATDSEAFAAALASIKEKYGKIDGVIHAAGIVEDKLFRNKEPDSFMRVYNTKVKPLKTVLETLLPDLKLLVMYSSAASPFGVAGQADYAAGNCVFDWTSGILKRRFPSLIVTAFDWGPWRGAGMVNESLEREFARRGVPLIGLREGGELFVNELKYGDESSVIVISNVDGGVSGFMSSMASFA